MTIIPSAPELPSLNSRDVTTLQFVDASGRIEALLINPLTGLPASEAGLREMVSDAQIYGVELDGRLGIDRKNKLTSKKTLAHRDRLKYFHALRRGARGIVRDPDPGVLSSKVDAARTVLDVVMRHGEDIKKLTRAETSAALRLLLKECEGDGLQAALHATDLHRYFVLLRQAHESYANLLSEAGLSEADSGDTREPAAEASALSLRELKAAIEDLLGLVFGTMAFHAAKGREPYARLLAQCREITQEINSDAKLRETRAKKADAKKTTAQAGTSTAASTGTATGSKTESRTGTERENGTSAPSVAASTPVVDRPMAPVASPVAEGDGLVS